MEIHHYHGHQLSPAIQTYLVGAYLEHFAWTEQMTLESMGNPLVSFLIAIESELPIGFISYQDFEGEVEILQVFVEPSYRKKGRGQRLLKQLQSYPEVTKIFLEVRASNDKAIKLYESQEMFLVSRRKKYYLNPEEDALIYQWTKEEADGRS